MKNKPTTILIILEKLAAAAVIGVFVKPYRSVFANPDMRTYTPRNNISAVTNSNCVMLLLILTVPRTPDVLGNPGFQWWIDALGRSQRDS